MKDRDRVEEAFRSALPAGDWADVRVLPAVAGMMHDRAWSISATARHVRSGEEAFMKCILPAGSSAGDVTKLVTAPERLERLRERLEAASKREDIPLVRLLELRLLEPMGALLVAMERIDPLSGLISQRRTQPSDAVALLRQLKLPERVGGSRGASDGKGSTDAGWLHFDVSPDNIGRRRSGEFVFIDPESLCFEESGRFPVSVPAFKQTRCPPQLVASVVQYLRKHENSVSFDIACRKANFELLRVAAECSLAVFLPHFRESDSVACWLERWPTMTSDLEAIRKFWSGVLSRIESDEGSNFNIEETAAELEVEINAALESTPAQTPGSFVSPSAATASLTDVEEGEQVPAPRSGRLAVLDSMGRMMRRYLLDRAGLEEYQRHLVEYLKENPGDREAWRELLHVLISYLRQPDAAHRACTEALRHFPNDSVLADWKQVLHNWRTGARSDVD